MTPGVADAPGMGKLVVEYPAKDSRQRCGPANRSTVQGQAPMLYLRIALRRITTRPILRHLYRMQEANDSQEKRDGGYPTLLEQQGATL